MDYLADRTGLMDASGIRKVFALAAELKDPVNFSIVPDKTATPRQPVTQRWFSGLKISSKPTMGGMTLR
ncbi:MAG: hypothetical protein ACYSOT_07780 [Planctomycetota bacterium]|jgi:hypothetical protein